MKTLTKTSYQMIVYGMIIALHERYKHHSIAGDEDIAQGYRKQCDLVQRQGYIPKQYKDSWTSDMFAMTWQLMRLDPNDYDECFNMFFKEGA